MTKKMSNQPLKQTKLSLLNPQTAIYSREKHESHEYYTQQYMFNFLPYGLQRLLDLKQFVSNYSNFYSLF